MSRPRSSTAAWLALGIVLTLAAGDLMLPSTETVTPEPDANVVVPERSPAKAVQLFSLQRLSVDVAVGQLISASLGPR